MGHNVAVLFVAITLVEPFEITVMPLYLSIVPIMQKVSSSAEAGSLE
jgi:hypothetical protein